MGKVRSKPAVGGDDPNSEITVRALGDQTSVTIDGDEYEVDADGTLKVELRLLPEFEAHGFERVKEERIAPASKKAK